MPARHPPTTGTPAAASTLTLELDLALCTGRDAEPVEVGSALRLVAVDVRLAPVRAMALLECVGVARSAP